MTRRYIFFGVGIFILGLLGGLMIENYLVSKKALQPKQESSSSHQIRQNGGYSYINPLLECDISEGTLNVRNENFHDATAEFVDNLKKRQGLNNVAVYFRDLNNGPSFGINANDEFFPASLLKVPVMMVYYHLAEKDPSILKMEIKYETKQEFDITPEIIPKEEIEIGQTYSVDELIRRMIVYSDNQALFLLSSRIPDGSMEDLFKMLGVGDDVIFNSEAKLTAKEYSGFFSILFNSSYLSRDFSERALKLLAETDYHDALSVGIPSNIPIAHKFGEAGISSGERQLHDCGIVYFPNHPYLACIMTSGNEGDVLRQSITEISQFIYQKVKGQY